MFRTAAVALFCVFLIAKPVPALAGDFIEDTTGNGNTPQGDMGDSNLDPFADYHEFEEDEQQEADENFFHNGRFFSVGILGGYESFTQTLGLLYSPSVILAVISLTFLIYGLLFKFLTKPSTIR